MQFYSEPESDNSKLTFDQILVAVSKTFFGNKLASMIESISLKLATITEKLKFELETAPISAWWNQDNTNII